MGACSARRPELLEASAARNTPFGVGVANGALSIAGAQWRSPRASRRVGGASTPPAQSYETIWRLRCRSGSPSRCRPQRSRVPVDHMGDHRPRLCNCGAHRSVADKAPPATSADLVVGRLRFSQGASGGLNCLSHERCRQAELSARASELLPGVARRANACVPIKGGCSVRGV